MFKVDHGCVEITPAVKILGRVVLVVDLVI